MNMQIESAPIKATVLPIKSPREEGVPNTAHYTALKFEIFKKEEMNGAKNLEFRLRFN
jgi:hypothetical protein